MDNAQQPHAARDEAHGAASASLSLPPAVEEHILSIGHRGKERQSLDDGKIQGDKKTRQFHIAA